MYTICFTAVILFLLVSCKSNNEESTMVEKKSFGKLSNGDEVFI